MREMILSKAEELEGLFTEEIGGIGSLFIFSI
jgi:hypothetical protein